jgi:dimeric dUTPase (all-alpha-NTP-PPase superfamily)
MTHKDLVSINSASKRLRGSSPILSERLKNILEKQKMEHTLGDIFNAQREFNTSVIPELYEKIKTDEAYRKRWLFQYNLAMQQEQAELIDSLNWKWWKKGKDNWDNVKVELIDILHFWVSMCTVAGMDSKEVMDLYFKKNKLNHKRQDEGYKEGTYDKYKDGVEDNINEVLNG